MGTTLRGLWQAVISSSALCLARRWRHTLPDHRGEVHLTESGPPSRVVERGLWHSQRVPQQPLRSLECLMERHKLSGSSSHCWADRTTVRDFEKCNCDKNVELYNKRH